MAPLLKVSIDSFVYEVRSDLPRLITEHPNGVYVQHLHEEYGESPTRILRAFSLLEQRGVVTVHQAANNSHYILPVSYEVPTRFIELTDLQRSLLDFIIKTTQQENTTLLRTNYSQLSRALQCSTGGVRTSLARLEQLDYIKTLNPAQQGKPSALLLELTDKAIGTTNI